MSDNEDVWEEEEVLDDDDDDFNRPTIDRFAFDDDDDDAGNIAASSNIPPPPPPPKKARLGGSAADDELVPYNNIVGRNPDTVRREYAVTDAVSYYNQVALWTMLYARATQGHAIPPLIFDPDKQTM
jgi:hypothetical protein